MRCCALVALAFLIGCSKTGEARYFGDWVQKNDQNGIAGALINGLVPKVKLTLKQDHTFVLILPTLSVSITGNSVSATADERIDGTWECSGDQVKFHATTDRGKPIQQIKDDIARAQADADAAKRQRVMEDALRRQQANAQNMYPQSLADTQAPFENLQANGRLNTSNQLQLPDSATMSDDGKVLTLHYVDNVAEAVDFDRK